MCVKLGLSLLNLIYSIKLCLFVQVDRIHVTSFTVISNTFEFNIPLLKFLQRFCCSKSNMVCLILKGWSRLSESDPFNLKPRS